MNFTGVILAAGDGTRMRSDTPKVMHKAAGLPMLEWVIRAVNLAGAKDIVLIFGRAYEELKQIYSDRAQIVCQPDRKGSGHAVMCAKDVLRKKSGYTLITAGDMPALKSETIKNMVKFAGDNNYDCVLLTSVLDKPAGYGRIIRDNASGKVLKIVEEKDASEAERAVGEVNASCYAVKNEVLLEALEKIEPKNAQGEYYLTDIVELINKKCGAVRAFTVQDTSECLGVNDRAQLAEVSSVLRERINRMHMSNGVTFIDPKAVYIDPDTIISGDVTIYPGVTIEDGCKINKDVILYPGSRISRSTVGEGTHIQNSVILDSEIGKFCEIGPYAYLRPNTKIGDGCRIGDFVEIKNSAVDDNTKVSHLTYIGDSDLGKNINIGCGVVFVNYDGKHKYRTKVGDNVFIGCNTNLISPVEVEDGAYIAAGTTVTDTVPKNTFAIGRARQINKTGWKDKRE